MNKEFKKSTLPYKETGDIKSTYTLIFLHGATMTKEGMIPFAEKFKEYHCIVFDLAAHGQSNEKEPKDVLEFAMRVEDSIKILQQEQKITKHLIIMGYSMGGAIACEIAIRSKVQMQGIVLLSTGANLAKYTPLIDKLQKQTRESFNATEFFQYLFGPGTTDAEKNIIMDGLNATKVCDEIAYQDLIISNKYNELDKMANINIPAMIVHGSDDKVILPMAAIDLWTTLPHSELLILPYRGHTAILEESDIIHQKVMAFLSKTII